MGPTGSELSPTLAEARVNVVMPRDPVVGRVVGTRLCTRSRKAAGVVRHVEIDVSGTALAGSFRAGQAFGVVPPGVDGHGKAHRLRLYSIASPTCGEDGAGCVLSTTVKRLIDEHHEGRGLFLGVASNYLCDLRPGDEVRVTGPSGKRFLLPARPGEHDYVFVATGTGIAPFRGMILELLSTAPGSRIVLIMGSPYTTDLLYDAELRELAAGHGNLTYLTAVSRDAGPEGDGPMYVSERFLTHRSLLEPMLRNPRTLGYVCGVAGMEVGVIGAMSRLLEGEDLASFVRVSPEAGPAEHWERRMIGRVVKPTGRLMLEVY
jgi:ferredoxin--NADP+ reductase